jgi:hypothetical protein
MYHHSLMKLQLIDAKAKKKVVQFEKLSD